MSTISDSNVRRDWSVLRDVTWWSWLVMIALLAMRFATGDPIYVAIAAAICGVLAGEDLGQREGDFRAMSVQIRIGYIVMLGVGLVPGMGWIHAVQLVGTTARVLVGFCLLHRGLQMFPWNLSERLTAATVWRILTAPPGAGGLWQFGEGESPCAIKIIGARSTCG